MTPAENRPPAAERKRILLDVAECLVATLVLALLLLLLGVFTPLL